MASKKLAIVLWEPGEVGLALMDAVQKRTDLEIIGVKMRVHAGSPGADSFPGVPVFGTHEDFLSLNADCVVVTPPVCADHEETDRVVAELLRGGKNVISTAAWHSPAMMNSPSGSLLRDTCRESGATFHGTGLHPLSMVRRLLITLCRALVRVDSITLMETLDLERLPDDFLGGLDTLGFGHPVPGSDTATAFPPAVRDAMTGFISDVAAIQFGNLQGLEFKTAVHAVPSPDDVATRGKRIPRGTTGAIRLTITGKLPDRTIITHEGYWYAGTANAPGAGVMPFAASKSGLGYSIRIAGEPTLLESQIELEPAEAGNPLVSLAAQSILDAIRPVCEAAPGILVVDTDPHFQKDERV